jgi:hypothetical protein
MPDFILVNLIHTKKHSLCQGATQRKLRGLGVALTPPSPDRILFFLLFFPLPFPIWLPQLVDAETVVRRDMRFTSFS